MTCVCGCEHGGSVWLGADSAVSDEANSVTIVDQSKAWVAAPGIVLAGAGDGRFLGLLRCMRMPDLPKQPTAAALDRWFVGPLASAIRKRWAPEAKARKSNDTEPDADLLVGVVGRLYYVRGALDFGHLADGFGAIGTGADVAIGALEALARRASMQPKTRLGVALTAAAKRTAFVSAPFTYVSA